MKKVIAFDGKLVESNFRIILLNCFDIQVTLEVVVQIVGQDSKETKANVDLMAYQAQWVRSAIQMIFLRGKSFSRSIFRNVPLNKYERVRIVEITCDLIYFLIFILKLASSRSFRLTIIH